VVNKLGDGAYSSVFKVKLKGDEEVYALKQVKMLQLTEKDKENALNESESWQALTTPPSFRSKQPLLTSQAALFAL
jgi:NIMA (never in mitosis gene a)-related kinase 1/4/5